MATKTPVTKTPTSSHSLRCTDALWSRSTARAKRDGVQINTVLRELLEGYSRGLIDLPKVTKQYSATRTEPTPAGE